ncbi:hypothetical protein [Tessaracoccus coleopterorum]|uniref:hypothetical protein n=1 Tax=Tessaracoccus coleopterorum TaxID=2714950 RepID=UPI001E64C294|nr:hypothetical protein [Tessaracoccus coleopterorum]
MTDVFPGLARLADRFGIAQEFWDWKGRHVPIPAETVVRVLRAFDIDASTPRPPTQPSTPSRRSVGCRCFPRAPSPSREPACMSTCTCRPGPACTSTSSSSRARPDPPGSPRTSPRTVWSPGG